MKKIALILSGSGVFDGAEIHESVLTMLAVRKAGATYSIFAPDIDQHHVINHITGEEMPESRNVLIESARIARGAIRALKEFNAVEYDALIFPGGFGAAKNLSTFAFEGENCSVNAQVKKAVLSMVELKKPIGALCIAPVILAKILGNNIKLTIGNDEGPANAITAMEGIHIEASHGEVVVDEKYKVVTTPCYMLDATIEQIEEGANNVVRIIMQMI